VVLTGDVHQSWANDLKADYADPDSATIGAELVCTSISTGGDGTGSTLVPDAAVNPHLRFFSDRRGYVRTRIGPVNVTRAALPVMRGQRSGLVVTISSTAGLEGGEFTSAYAASKFGVEGWMESLAPEVAPFGIRTMLVEPGFFRTELLTPESTKYAASSVEDYAERTEQTVTAWKGMNGQQGGDPAKLADALVYLAGQPEPPLRFAAGADVVAAFERRANNLLAQADAYRDLSSSLALDSD
jgi:NAD(P)-dependent dehydrogenase (short-subunit alcohol dehydrogenase family)